MSNAEFGQRQHLRHVVAIAVRDLLEFLRDRRTVFITLLLPMLMYPIVAISSAVGLRTAVREQERQEAAVPLAVALSGDGADALVARIARIDRSKNAAADFPLRMDVVDARGAIERLEEGLADFWVDVPEGFDSRIESDGTFRLEAVVGGRESAVEQARRQLAGLLEGVSKQVVLERLDRAGLPMSVLEPIQLTFRDPVGRVVEAGRRSVPSIVAPILVLLSVLTLTGAFYPAVDAIAGEKERGTIETLLVAPCPAWEIAAGKFVAVYVVAIITLVSNLLSLVMTALVVSRYAPGQLDLFPRQTAFGVGVAIVSFLALAAVGSAVCLAVTTASRSTKEAQHSLTPVIIAVSLLSGIAISPTAKAFGILSLVPITGQVLVAREALAATASSSAGSVLAALAVSVTAAAAITCLVLWMTGSLLVDEEVLFRGPDSAEGLLRRPMQRSVPTIMLAILPTAFGFAALWYGQAFVPDDLILAIPVQQMLSLVLPLAVLEWWQRVDLVRTFKLGLPRGGLPVWAMLAAGSILLGLGAFCGGAVVSSALEREPSSEAVELSSRIAACVASHPLWVVWLVMALLPAVCEEFVFRGWMLSGLVGRHTDPPRHALAIAVQATLFSVMHLLPERIPSTFVLGCFLGWVTIRSGSILPAIVCHAVHNMMPVAAVSLAPDAAALAIRPGVFAAAGAAAGIAGVLLIMMAAGLSRGRGRAG